MHLPFRRISSYLALALMVSVAIPMAVAAPAAASSATLTRRPQPVVENHRGIYASLRPSDAAGWQGTVTFDHTVASQGNRQLRRTTRAQIDLWRQVCDVAGCIETDVSATGVGSPSQEWAADLAKGSMSLPVVVVKVVRYAVDDSQYRKLDEVALRLPLSVAFTRTADKLQQALVANTTTLSTTSVTKQVNASVRVALGDMTMSSIAGSAAGTIITTTVRR